MATKSASAKKSRKVDKLMGGLVLGIEIMREDANEQGAAADYPRPPLQEIFPRWHLVCDRCSAPLEARRASGAIETAAGSFRYAFCGTCCDARRKMSKVARQSSMHCALVNHAAQYSPEFGAFVAAWFGVTRNQTRSRRGESAKETIA